MNWCQTVRIADEERAQAVGSPDAAAAALQAAGGRVQLLGNRFSVPALLDATGDQATALALVSDGPAIVGETDDTITVTGDCALGDLYEHLRGQGRTLPVCPPVITFQTVAGALGTGTHAQGLGEGLLSDAVVALTIVDAAGAARTVRASDPDFGAYALHLGALGLVTTVTFATVPNCTYHVTKSVVSGDDLLATFEARNRSIDHVKAWWWVEEDRAHLWEVAPSAQGVPAAQPTDADGVQELNQILAATQERLGADTGVDSRSAAPQRTVGRFYDFAHGDGDLVEIMRNGIPAPQINMEVGVPLERFAAASLDLKRALAASEFALHYPVILRPTGPSAAWLSSAYERAVVWYGFVVYQRPDGSVPAGSMELLGAIQEALAAHGGLPHWGKHFEPEYFDFAQLPRYRDWVAAREAADPGRRLLSPAVARALRLG